MLTLQVKSPARLLGEQLDVLAFHLPGIWDAADESVHQARIATRRIRELLPFSRREIDSDVKHRVRVLGRALGRHRDWDVMIAGLNRVELAYPAGAGVAATARVAARQRRRESAQRLIESLERLDLDELLSSLREATHERRLPWSRPWAGHVRDRVALRASQLLSAVESGHGVYIADRSHQVRIAIKRLRYALEVVIETAVWRPAHMLRDLKRTQAVLGEARDTQVLEDQLPTLLAEGGGQAEDAARLSPLLDAQIEGFHREFLRRRERLRLACDACLSRAAAA